MNPRVRLQNLSELPITNGLGLSGQHDNPDWPRYIRTTDIKGPTSVRSDVFASQPPEVAQAALLREGDIVVCAVGATVGKSLLYREATPACYAGFLVRFRANESTDPRFVSYWMQSADYWAQVEQNVVKSTIENLSASRFRALSIPRPELVEQRRVADFLDDRVSQIDRIITARREQLSLIAQWHQSQLSSVMDRQAALSGVAPLRRFCAGIEQGSSPIAEDRPAELGESGVLKTSAVFRGTFCSERYKSIQSDNADPRHKVRNRDVIIIRGSGSADLVGDAATACLDEGGPNLYLSDLTYRLRGLQISPEYAVLAIISARGRSELGSRVRQGSGPAKARGDDIMAIPVPVASPTEQRACEDEAALARKESAAVASGVTRAIDLLTEYKTSLITAAVTGELDVTHRWLQHSGVN